MKTIMEIQDRLTVEAAITPKTLHQELPVADEEKLWEGQFFLG